MKKDNPEKNETAALLATLDEKNMTLLDFDGVKNCLREMAEKTRLQESLADDAAVLRDDYVSRIAGMLKALAAVDRKRDGWAQALELVERLPVMKAAELVACYRKLSVRFRDAFPASFNRSPALRFRSGLKDLDCFG